MENGPKLHGGVIGRAVGGFTGADLNGRGAGESGSGLVPASCNDALLRRNSAKAKTACQSMKPNTLMRSHTPSHGVGRFAPTPGALQNDSAPNTNSTTIVAIE